MERGETETEGKNIRDIPVWYQCYHHRSFLKLGKTEQCKKNQKLQNMTAKDMRFISINIYIMGVCVCVCMYYVWVSDIPAYSVHYIDALQS